MGGKISISDNMEKVGQLACFGKDHYYVTLLKAISQFSGDDTVI